ncbi:hypothetical protein ABB37_00008 [Leptomonas pyrrhocoris]|uniref:BAG domain-containing protein n=1 Tax=Leptomonas pyrrhocoris TaxID=157538 RepID=A0A0M9G9N1_LEPPY|nr:hypothetical protein ABB37_00008 [Leptomonas pyrrhocoris]XP_015664037.1 hypothetical protein ABB37_00008 [Leptomonas pyrrhocoris]KPA85597.1 hypothetical protein ABB37_00008 [Leptomonas pyrrhocoris]KPA85598.1 hypothetical protein ABB37_00008 [Leptomonas pyrrhocoris]|eukprot:XP_015664036.1 hypothetical protein ABB37_00008 [Leptomonas pyrrhocoris]
MAYYGYQPEQTKAQIRSTRGETIDLALPLSCPVGELRNFLIDEYNYDPNTRLLYNGLIADDNSYVCDYPFGSLMIATPADMQSHRQPLPPRQQHQQPQLYQQRPQEPARTSPRTSAPPNSGTSRKTKPAEMNNTNANNAEPRRMSQTDGSPDSNKKNKTASTVKKHPPKRSPRKMRSTSAESDGSDGAAPQSRAANAPTPPVPVDASPPPTAAAAAVREGVSPSNNSVGSARGQANRVNSARTPNTATDAVDASSSPSSTAAAPPQRFSPPPPPSPPQPQPSSAPAAAPPSPSAAQPSSPAVDVQNAAEDEHNHRLRVRFTVECHIPSLKRVVQVQMNGESSVVDLVLAVVAEVPEIGGEAQVVFRGKILPQNPQAKLFDLGMRADTRVFVAAGEYSNPETITLLEIEKDTSEIDKATKTNLTDLQRKGFYEELMRILFRTDGLQSLEGEWRQRRKDAVKRITELQDKLGVEGSGTSV